MQAHGSAEVMTCAFGANQPGIQKAAEWVRTDFHDAATHDAASKTGGLDASIQFELDRPENLGAALNNTLADISNSVNVRSSVSDLLALSLVMSVARCGNMRVPLRLGRKDATEAGSKGVPEAHTDLDTTRKRFATASLNEADMITLNACGHSIGGVHSVDHPEIVPGLASAETKLSFDSSLGVLDNNVVLEYLENSTANPLIRNNKDILNSDKRIFASNENATMDKLADPQYFKSQCEAVFERMLGLVPEDIALSAPLAPADVRPYIEEFHLDADGSVRFSGRIRVRITPITGRDSNTMTAFIVPNSRNGSVVTEIAARRAMFRGGTSFGYLDEEFLWFEFSQNLNTSDIFSSFNIRVNDIIYDNGDTGGYPVNTEVLFQKAQSCRTFDATTKQGTLKVTAAISRSLLQGDIVPIVRIVQKTKVQGNFIPRLKEEVIPMERSSKESGEYAYFTASTMVGVDGLRTSFDLEVGGSKVEFLSTGVLAGQCAEL